MNKKIRTTTLQLQGLTCVACETKIEQKVGKLPGVERVQLSFSTQKMEVTYDANLVTPDTICKTIEQLHYQVISNSSQSLTQKPWNKYLEITVILILLVLGYLLIDNTIGFSFVPKLDQSMGLITLFLIGLLTSVHCVAMCGGITLSFCMGGKTKENEPGSKTSTAKTLIFYHGGRLVSYSLIGGIVGGIGAVFSLSYAGKATIQILAGVFMILMGLQLLLQSPKLRKFIPHMPRFFARKVFEQKAGRGPFLVGMLNGLMPCGPLSAMQIYALGTGSVLLGALSMFLFTLGTIPLLFAFGMLSGILKKRMNQVLLKVSAALVLFLGISMIQRGLVFTEGIGITERETVAQEIISEKEIETSEQSTEETMEEVNSNTPTDEIQEISSIVSSRGYEDITVKAGVPVKWTLMVEEKDLNGCNYVMVIPAYELQIELVAGENIIEFTPGEEGVIQYSCWMGMIRNTITVVE